MCGRFVIAKNLVEALPDLLGNIDDWDSEFISYNIAPTAVVPIVAQETVARGEIAPRLSLAHWGLIPHWRKDLTEKPQPFNARIETVATSGMFRAAFQRQRCIVPASAYYEWLTNDGTKTPYLITTADPGAAASVVSTPPTLGGLAFAGIYEDHAEGPRSVAIITRPSLGPVGFIHDRMPVMLTPAGYEQWMGTDLRSADEAQDLLMSESALMADNLQFWQVDKRVGNVRNNSQDLVLPCETAQ